MGSDEGEARKDFDVHLSEHERALMNAVYEQNYGEVRRLLCFGVNPDVHDKV